MREKLATLRRSPGGSFPTARQKTAGFETPSLYSFFTVSNSTLLRMRRHWSYAVRAVSVYNNRFPPRILYPQNENDSQRIATLHGSFPARTVSPRLPASRLHPPPIN